MANETFTRPAPFGSVTIYQSVTFFQAAAEALEAWRKSRKTRVLLNRLSDDVLEDIGVSRADIKKM